MIGLRSVLPNAKIVNFEDDGEGILKADLVFNALFKENELPQVHAGEKYYISGKTFMFYNPIEIKDKVERVFISFGGADPQNYCSTYIALLFLAPFLNIIIEHIEKQKHALSLAIIGGGY